MATICLSPRGSHVGLKFYMAGPCHQARCSEFELSEIAGVLVRFDQTRTS